MTSGRVCGLAIGIILSLLLALGVCPALAEPPAVARDVTPPTVAITTPTTSGTYRSDWAAIALGGTSAGEAAVTHVSWRNDRGGDGVASGTASWWIPTISLHPGANVITVTAHDLAGIRASATLTVTSDLFLAPPSVAILAPAPGAIHHTTSAAIDLSGTALDSAGITQITWTNARGGEGSADGIASWSAPGIPLQPGLNELTITARDPGGGITTASLSVMYEAPAPLARVMIGPALVTSSAGGGPASAAPRRAVEAPAGAPAAAAPVSAVTGPSGLVAAYTFEEGTGTTTADVTGHDNTGTLSGGVTWTPQGRFGGALVLNGSALVTVPHQASLDLTSAMTLAAWVYPTATPLNGSTVVVKEQTEGLAYALHAGAGTSRPGAQISVGGAGAPGVNGPAVLPLNTWTHLACTFDGAALRLYVDGSLVASESVAGTIATSDGALRIGGNTHWGQYFRGRIDEVRIYDRALALAEIQHEMSSPFGTPLPDLTPPTVAITTPAPATTHGTTAASIALGGIADDDAGVTEVSWANDRGGSGIASGTTAWSIAALALAPGPNLITITARDAAGNTGSASLTVVYDADTTPPAVAIVAPSGGGTYSTNVSPLTLSGTASDDRALAQVAWSSSRGGAGVASGTTDWSVTGITLLRGFNVLTVTARDAAGQTATATLTVIYDYTAPALAITTPTAAATYSTTASSITLGGTAGDYYGVAQVTWANDRGGSGVAEGTTAWSIADLVLQPGDNVVTVTARDPAGNARTATLTVTFSDPSGPPPPDSTPPAVVMTSPAPGATLAGYVSLSALATDNVDVASVQFLVDGVPLGAALPAAPYAVVWDTAGVGLGPRTLTAVARDQAGNAATSVPVPVTLVAPTPATVGQWVGPLPAPIVAIHATLQRTGEVVMWDGLGNGGDVHVWNPRTNAFEAAENSQSNVFCSGHCALPDGRILVAGGHINTHVGLRHVNIFDPMTRAWTMTNWMSRARWYPTMTTLPDGRMLVTAGEDNCDACDVDLPEVFDPQTSTWTALTGARLVLPFYPHMFVLPDGRVLAASATEDRVATQALTVATQTWEVVDPVTVDGGSAVMYVPGKIMKAGTSADADMPPVPTAPTTYVIDMTQPLPSWRQTAPMAFPRGYHNLTLLPDGTVLATGGGQTTDAIAFDGAIEAAELWSPVTQTWTTLAAMQVPRLYHSTALLLPDARVLVAGGGRYYGVPDQTDQTSIEIFSPPYLFKGPRPVIATAPAAAGYGTAMAVQTPDAARIASVALVKPGSVTHSFNMDQRLVPLSFTAVGTTLTVQAPANGNLAPPGYYMLFIVDTDGVPSEAAFVRIQ